MLHSSKKAPLALSLVCSALLLAGCGGSDKNDAPTLTGNESPSVQENTTLVGNYVANDQNGDALTLSLSGADSALFTVTQAGELSFKSAPDFETAGKTSFSVTLTATESEKDKLSASLNITVSLDDVKDTPDFAVVQTIAPDYSSSEVVYIDAYNQEVENGFYIKEKSDYTVASYQSDVYHIGRFNIDTIDKYNVNSKDTKVWGFSTQDNQDTVSRNPYTLVSLNESKAYLIRHGSGKVWIVNPQATQAEDFKIGELDITAYSHNNSNNTPSPAAGVIADGKLFIAMQRLGDDYSAAGAYVAVFDTETDTEIETNANSEDAVKGIPLQGVNPLANSIIAADDKVYVTTHNSWGPADLSLSKIEEIATSDYALKEVLSVTDFSDEPNTHILSTAIVSPEKGYFYSNEILYSPYRAISTLHEFNPSTGEVVNSSIHDIGESEIKNLKLDSANFLWLSVSNPAEPGVDVINTETNEQYKDRLLTELNPGNITFVVK